MLKYFPLIITQAVAFITENKISLTEYIVMLRIDDLKLASFLNKNLTDFRRNPEAFNSVE